MPSPANKIKQVAVLILLAFTTSLAAQRYTIILLLYFLDYTCTCKSTIKIYILTISVKLGDQLIFEVIFWAHTRLSCNMRHLPRSRYNSLTSTYNWGEYCTCGLTVYLVLFLCRVLSVHAWHWDPHSHPDRPYYMGPLCLVAYHMVTTWLFGEIYFEHKLITKKGECCWDLSDPCKTAVLVRLAQLHWPRGLSFMAGIYHPWVDNELIKLLWLAVFSGCYFTSLNARAKAAFSPDGPTSSSYKKRQVYLH